jgi:hypothetical protein
MSECNPSTTPIDTKPKLSIYSGPPVSDPALYHSLVGALQYAILTHPDIAYAVQQVCLHMHDPRDSHLLLIKIILRYLKGTFNFGLTLHSSLHTTSLPTQMPTGLDAQTPDAPLLGFACFLLTI